MGEEATSAAGVGPIEVEDCFQFRNGSNSAVWRYPRFVRKAPDSGRKGDRLAMSEKCQKLTSAWQLLSPNLLRSDHFTGARSIGSDPSERYWFPPRQSVSLLSEARQAAPWPRPGRGCRGPPQTSRRWVRAGRAP